MSNKNAREKLIEKYGAECFIEKLHLRVDTTPRKYTSKSQMQKMKQLSFHHILEKSKGGKTTPENGALLSIENHRWFHKQSPMLQKKMNSIFQKYKNYIDCQIELVDELEMPFVIATTIIVPKEFEKAIYNRAKEKQKWMKTIEEERDNK